MFNLASVLFGKIYGYNGYEASNGRALNLAKFLFNRTKRFLVPLIWLVLLSGCASFDKKRLAEHALPADSNYMLIAPELLAADVEQLVERTIEIHPEAFAVISEQEFRIRAEAIKESIRYPLTSSGFYLRLAPLLAGLKDIHSFIRLPKTLDFAPNLKHSNDKPPRLFPVAVLYENESLYVAADLTEYPQIPTGAIITSIDGIPIEFLLNNMEKLTVTETEAGKRRKIQIDFPWLLSVLGYAKESYLIGYQWKEQSKQVLITGIIPIVDIEQKTESSELRAESDSDITEQSIQNLADSDETHSMSSFYGHSQIDANTELLWFNDFHEKPHVFADYLELRFRGYASSSIDNLIIDVRYNGGGLSQNIKSLLSYLTHTPIEWSHKGEIKVSEPLRKLHQQKTKQRRENKFSWGIQWIPLEWTDALQYELSWSDVGEIIPVEFKPVEPAQNIIPNNIKVLVNGFCFSACATFTAVVNQYGLAETIGENAGSIADIQYVYPIKTKLAYSGLELSLPTMKVYLKPDTATRRFLLANPYSLVSPYVDIKRTAEQIVAREDIILAEAIKRLKSAQ